MMCTEHISVRESNLEKESKRLVLENVLFGLDRLEVIHWEERE